MKQWEIQIFREQVVLCEGGKNIVRCSSSLMLMHHSLEHRLVDCERGVFPQLECRPCTRPSPRPLIDCSSSSAAESTFFEQTRSRPLTFSPIPFSKFSFESSRHLKFIASTSIARPTLLLPAIDPFLNHASSIPFVVLSSPRR